jgi:hypothetical protein
MRRTVTTTLLIALAIVLSTVGVALATGTADASRPPAAPSPLPPTLKPGATTMGVAPQSLSADSTTAPLTFTFRSGGNLRGALHVTVPAGWSPPQVDDTQGVGLLAVDRGDCANVGAPAVSGSGPWTVSMDIACNAGRSFTLSYGAAGLTPAPTVDTYTFPTSFIGRLTTTSIEPPPEVQVTPGAAATLQLDQPTTVEAGEATDVSLTVRDQFGNTATGYTGTVGFASTDEAATLPDPVAFTAEDAGTITLTAAVTHRTAGVQTLTATDTNREDLSDSVEVTVTPGPATALRLEHPTTVEAGVATDVSLTGIDDFGNTATGYIGTVGFTSTDEAATLPEPVTFTAEDPETITLPGAVTHRTAGEQTLTATDTDTDVSDSVEHTVTPGPAATLHLDHPTTAEAGEATDVSVTVKDEFGNTATGYTGTVGFTSTDEAATLPDPVTFTAEDAGTISLPAAVTHRTAGRCTPSVLSCVWRSAHTLAVADASQEDLSAGVDVTVTPGPAARLSVRQLPAAKVDPQLPSTFVFYGPLAIDAYDNVVTDQLDVRFSAGPGNIRLVGNPTDGIITINRPNEIAFPMIELTSASAGVQTLKWELVGKPEVSHSQRVVVYDARTATLEVEDPYFTGVTRFRVNPLVAWQGPPLPGVSTAPSQQPTLTVNGKTYQLGELTAAPDGSDLVWDLDPPASASPSDPEHTLHRCDGQTVCTIDGVVVGESTATFAWTVADFAHMPPLQAQLNLHVVGDGRGAPVRPDLTGDIPFTLNLTGLNITENLFVPWNTSLTVTSIGDNGLVSVLVPLPTGGTVETTLSIFTSASLVTGSQLFLEEPLVISELPFGRFESVRVLPPPPPPPVDLGNWVPPPLFASTGVLFNLIGG